MFQPGFHHRIGARFAIFFKQMLFKAACVHADADRTVVIARGLDHLAHALGRPDVARVDPQAGGARLGGLDPAFIVEVNVGHDGHRAFGHDLAQRARRLLVGHGNPHDIGSRLGRGLHLCNGGGHIGGQRIGHGLHRNRRIAPHWHRPNHDLPGLAAVDVPPGADMVQRHGAAFRDAPDAVLRPVSRPR